MICIKCRKTAPDGLYCALCGARQNTAAGASRQPRRRGNGMGTVFKRGRTWTAQYTNYTEVTEDGRYRRHYITKGGFATKKEALLWLEQNRNGTGRTVPTLLELWKVYEENDLPKLSKDKQTAYRKARERLECIIGRRIDTLTTSDLQTAVSKNAGTYYTCRDMKNLLSHLYKRACADGFVPSNLAQYITLPELREKETEPFTPDEVRVMWSAWSSGDLFAGYLLLMVYSGMMPGELLSAKIEDIDLDRCEVYRTGKKTTVRKERPIVFAEAVQPVVASLIGGRTKGKLVKANKDRWYTEYHAATRRIGIRDLPPYACRHTTGTQAANLGLNSAFIQEVMRHAKITTSQRYIHIGSEQAHAALNELSAPSFDDSGQT